MLHQMLLGESPIAPAVRTLKTDLLAVLDGLRRSGYGSAKLLVSSSRSQVTPAAVFGRRVVWWPRSSYDRLKAVWTQLQQLKILFNPFPLDAALVPGTTVTAINTSGMTSEQILDEALKVAPSVAVAFNEVNKFVKAIEGRSFGEKFWGVATPVIWIGAIAGGGYYAYRKGWVDKGVSWVKSKV